MRNLLRRLRDGLTVMLATGIFCLAASTGVAATPEPSYKAAFIRNGHLWIKEGASEERITIDGTAQGPLWSHDGRWIAYTYQQEIWAYDTLQRQSYRVYRQGGRNYQWAPDKNVLAFLDGSVLNISDLRLEKPKPFVNVALGVDQYAWQPDGSGFLASSSANLLPTGWTNPMLFKIPLEKPSNPEDLFQGVQRFFTVPQPVKKGKEELLAIGTSTFKWSGDGKWIAFIVSPTASWAMDSNMLCVVSADGRTFLPIGEMLARKDWFEWAPSSPRLASIQGEGRIISGITNKRTIITSLPSGKEKSYTPKSFVDIGLTWYNNRMIAVSRAGEQETASSPGKPQSASLYLIDLQSKQQKRLTSPPVGSKDVQPYYLKASHMLTWMRANDKQRDIWISGPSGEKPAVLIRDVQQISWFERPAVD